MANEKVHTDPVCGLEVNEDNAAGKSRHDGETYYFCSSDCKERFDLNPLYFTTSVVPKE